MSARNAAAVAIDTFLDGAHPAQYGFRTRGIAEVTSPSGFTAAGEVGTGAGSRQTLRPNFNCRARRNTEYLVAGRYFDAYYMTARDLLDGGRLRPVLVLNENEGPESKAVCQCGGVRAYGA